MDAWQCNESAQLNRDKKSHTMDPPEVHDLKVYIGPHMALYTSELKRKFEHELARVTSNSESW